jgi:hypothetical protein
MSNLSKKIKQNNNKLSQSSIKSVFDKSLINSSQSNLISANNDKNSSDIITPVNSNINNEIITSSNEIIENQINNDMKNNNNNQNNKKNENSTNNDISNTIIDDNINNNNATTSNNDTNISIDTNIDNKKIDNNNINNNNNIKNDDKIDNTNKNVNDSQKTINHTENNIIRLSNNINTEDNKDNSNDNKIDNNHSNLDEEKKNIDDNKIDNQQQAQQLDQQNQSIDNINHNSSGNDSSSNNNNDIKNDDNIQVDNTDTSEPVNTKLPREELFIFLNDIIAHPTDSTTDKASLDKYPTDDLFVPQAEDAKEAADDANFVIRSNKVSIDKTLLNTLTEKNTEIQTKKITNIIKLLDAKEKSKVTENNAADTVAHPWVDSDFTLDKLLNYSIFQVFNYDEKTDIKDPYQLIGQPVILVKCPKYEKFSNAYT